MKYYGVVHGRTPGYNNEVRKLFGQLKAFMDTTNQKFGFRKKLLVDGAEVRVSIIMNGAVPIYRAIVIPAESVVAAQAIDTIFMESGLCRVTGYGDNFGTEIYYTDELEADLGVLSDDPPGISWLDWLTFNNNEITSTSRPYVESMESLAIHDNATMQSYTLGINTGAQSGKALLLWQAMVGARDLERKDYNGQTIPE